MKKTILLTFCALISTAIFAQSNTKFGIKTGLNLAHQTRELYHIRPGIHAGVFADYTINKFFGIQGELLYSMMGAKHEYAYSYVDYGVDGYYTGTDPYYVKATYKNDYIVLPILAKLYMAKGFSLDLGPQFGYMISEKEKRNISGNEPAAWYYRTVDNKFDIAFAMGLSYKLSNQFDISGRYNLGLTKIGNDYKSKNNVIQFGVGYRLK